MLIEIVQHTPVWVFILFFVLLVLGVLQSKERAIGRGTVLVLPIAMLVLSFYGVLSAFGIALAGVASWLLGIGIAVWLGPAFATPRGVTYSTEARLFVVPGSWLPLALMMGIFFIKYAVGVVLARRLPIAVEPAFIAAIGFFYGFFSGVFLARVFMIWRSAR